MGWDNELTTYSITTQITAGACIPSKLRDEIAASGAVTGFRGSPVVADTIHVLGSSINDQALLDSTVLNHDGLPVSPLAMLPLMLDKNADPRTLNYRSELLNSLHRKEVTTWRGEMRDVDFYIDSTEAMKCITTGVYQDAACTIPGWLRTPNGLADKRWKKREWLREDGTVAFTKISGPKVYSDSNHKQMKEGRRRRQNVIDFMMIDVLNMLVVVTALNPMAPTLVEIVAAEDLGKAFLETFSSQISDYLRGGDLSWKTPPKAPNVQNDNSTWLDYTFDGLNPAMPGNEAAIIAIAASSGWTGLTIRAEILAALIDVMDP